MTAVQATSLVETLETLLDRIARRESVADQLTEISRIQREIAPNAPAQLRHFLQNRSYTKALEYLKTGFVVEDPNRPDCEEKHT